LAVASHPARSPKPSKSKGGSDDGKAGWMLVESFIETSFSQSWKRFSIKDPGGTLLGTNAKHENVTLALFPCKSHARIQIYASVGPPLAFKLNFHSPSANTSQFFRILIAITQNISSISFLPTPHLCSDLAFPIRPTSLLSFLYPPPCHSRPAHVVPSLLSSLKTRFSFPEHFLPCPRKLQSLVPQHPIFFARPPNNFTGVSNNFKHCTISCRCSLVECSILHCRRPLYRLLWVTFR